VESLSLLDIVSYSLVPFPEEEEKPVKRRGRPRKVRDVPDVANVRNVRGKKLFKDDGHSSSGEESISASDHQGHGEDNDSDDDTDQPLINTIRSSAAKLRSLKISQKGTSSQKGAPGSSATFQDFFSLLHRRALKESKNECRMFFSLPWQLTHPEQVMQFQEAFVMDYLADATGNAYLL